MKEIKMNIHIKLAIFAVLILALGAVGFWATAPKPVQCPLVKQGCNCGTLCTKNFDCVKGTHD